MVQTHADGSPSAVEQGGARFACRLCGFAVQSQAWGGGECLDCGSVSMPVLPTAAEIASFYATYNQNYTGGGASAGQPLFADRQKAQASGPVD
jgi:hypothetical protein